MRRLKTAFITCFVLLGLAASLQAQTVTAKPTSINFGAVSLGNSAQNSFTLLYAPFCCIDSQIPQSSDLIVNLSSNNTVFVVSPIKVTLVPNQPVGIQVTFSPTQAGAFNGVINVTTTQNNQTVPVAAVNVAGTGIGNFTFNPRSLTFPPTLIGRTSAAMNFSIQVPAGAAPNGLMLSSSNPSIFQVTPAMLSVPSMGGMVNAQVTFSPNNAGLLRGAIIVSNGTANQSLAVEGEGLAFLLNPLTLNLGATLVGCSALGSYDIIPGGTFAFTNATGENPLGPGVFSLNPELVTTNEQTPVAVTFTPSGAGLVRANFTVLARTSGQILSRIVQTTRLPAQATGVAASISASSLDFGDVAVGSPATTRTLTVSLGSMANLMFMVAAVSSNPAFQVQSIDNATGLITLAFNPQAEGPAAGVLTVNVSTPNSPDCSVPFQVALSGNGGPALISLNPPGPIDFGNVSLGNRATRDVVMVNASPSTFRGTIEVDNPAFSVLLDQGGASFSIPGASQRTFTLAFDPTAAQLERGLIRFNLSGLGPNEQAILITRSLAVLGTGIDTTQITLNPVGPIDFGPVVLGSTGSAQVSIVNGSPTQFNGTFSINNPAFSIQRTGQGQIAFSLGPQETVNFALSFNPTQAGLAQGAVQFNLASARGAGQPITVNRTLQLRGVGFDPQLITLDPAGPLDFGVVSVGGETTIDVLLSNGTSAPLAGTFVSDNPAFVVVPASGQANYPLPALGSERFSIIFRPQQAVREAGMVTFRVRGGDAGLEVVRILSLSGLGFEPTLVTINPAQPINFGQVNVGDSASQPSTLANPSAAELTGTFEVTNPVFTLTPSDPLPGVPNGFRLPAGGTVNFNIAFAPNAAQIEQATVTFRIQAPGARTQPIAFTRTLILSGIGIDSGVITLNPDGAIDFGPVGIGAEAARPLGVANSSNLNFTATFRTDNNAFLVIAPGASQPAGSGTFALSGNNGMAALQVVFRPTLAQSQTATLSLQFTAQPGTGDPIVFTRSVSLLGVGVEPTLSFQLLAQAGAVPVLPGGTIDLTRTPVGGNSTTQFRVTNSGDSAAAVNSVTLSADSILISVDRALPTVLQPGQALTLSINFTPAAPRRFTAGINIDRSQFVISGIGILGGGQVTGLAATVQALGQPRVGVQITQPTPIELVGVLELRAVTQGNIPVGQAVAWEFGQCPTPGVCTVPFTIPQGTNTSRFANNSASIAFAAGTVAARFDVSATFTSGGADVSPTQAVVASTTMNAAAPALTSVAITNRQANSFIVEVRGYTNTRQATTANFTFVPRTGVELNPRTLTITEVQAAFQTFFNSAQSAASGGAFLWRQPFNISGEQNAVQSLTVTLSNSAGASTAASANVQ